MLNQKCAKKCLKTVKLNYNYIFTLIEILCRHLSIKTDQSVNFVIFQLPELINFII